MCLVHRASGDDMCLHDYAIHCGIHKLGSKTTQKLTHQHIRLLQKPLPYITGSLVKLSWNLQISLVQEPHGCAYVDERVH